MPARSNRSPIPFALLLKGRKLRESQREPAEKTAAEVAAKPAVPKPPGWLPADAVAVWRTTVRKMQTVGTWHPLFADALALYSALTAELRANPAAFKAAKLTQLRLLTADLGLTPATIEKVAQSVAVQGASSDFDEIDG